MLYNNLNIILNILNFFLNFYTYFKINFDVYWLWLIIISWTNVEKIMYFTKMTFYKEKKYV